MAFDKSQYIPPYIPKKEEVSNMKSILDLIPIIRWLEETYYSSKGITTPDVAQARRCYLAVLDYLYQYQYKDYKWEFISPVDFSFINFINSNYSEHENIKMIYPYIFAKEEGEDNDKVVTRAKLVTGGELGIFELPHLAVVIKCYIESMTPGSWSAWAGDFATAVKEVYVNCQENSEEYISFAIERIGAMEADEVNVLDARMFNYCDLIADLDGYAIEKLMNKSLSRYSLSECMKEYYSDSEKYEKRYQYFKPIIGFDNWNVIDIKTSIIKHFNLILKKFFAPNADDYPLSDDAAAIVLALNILFWAKYTSVI